VRVHTVYENARRSFIYYWLYAYAGQYIYIRTIEIYGDCGRFDGRRWYRHDEIRERNNCYNAISVTARVLRKRLRHNVFIVITCMEMICTKRSFQRSVLIYRTTYIVRPSVIVSDLIVFVIVISCDNYYFVSITARARTAFWYTDERVKHDRKIITQTINDSVTYCVKSNRKQENYGRKLVCSDQAVRLYRN